MIMSTDPSTSEGEVLNDLHDDFIQSAESYRASASESGDHNDQREYRAMARAYEDAASRVKSRMED